METKQNVIDWLKLLNSDFDWSEEYDVFVTERLARSSDNYLSLGGLSELGELADVLAKGMRPGRTFDYPKFLDELGDCLFYFTANLGVNDICKCVLDRLVFLAEVSKVNYTEHQLIKPSIKALERINMEKLNKRQKDTGSHLK